MTIPVPELPALSLSQVETRGTPGLCCVSLSVAHGEVLGLAGAEGAALLSAVAGRAKIRAGEIHIDGHLALETPPHRRRLGMVAPDLPLLGHLPVRAQLALARGLDEATLRDLLDRLDLRSVAGQHPASLSPGQIARAAFARALAHRPALLLLEEPFAGLSDAEAAALKSFVRDWAQTRRLGVLAACAEAADLYGLADRVAVLGGGRLHQLGAPAELYDDPQTLHVARTMGALNVLDGQAVLVEDGIATVRLAGGWNVEGRAVDAMRPGMQCALAIRPEKLAVAALQLAEHAEGAVTGRLRGVRFEGALTRLTVGLDGGDGSGGEIAVLRPNGSPLPRAGNIALAWQPHQASVFATELC
jgi:putative spermidine/putrescine transport system ATP-binding protein